MLVLFQRKIIYMGTREFTWSRVRVNREIGYVPPGARTEQVSDTTVPRGLRCEEIKVSGGNGSSLFGVVVSSSELGTNSRLTENPPENPETLFFYLQGPTFTARLPESTR